MLGFALIGGVLLVWAVVIALVWFGKGDVGVTPAVRSRIRFQVAVDNATRAIAEQFTPALRALAAEMKKAADALEATRRG